MSTTETKHPKVHFKVVIPARYQSRRLRGKPLCLLSGKPLIQHVYQRALESDADEVVVASDDPRIIDCVSAFGGHAVLTSSSPDTGSDRVAELAAMKGWADSDIVVNWQGDEPFLSPQDIQKAVVALVQQPQADIATLAVVASPTDLASADAVSVVCNQDNFALYFSRAIIPCGDGGGLRHMGVYVYHCAYLRHFAALQRPQIELRESLEQLRALWHGGQIYVAQATASRHVAIDTPADLLQAEKLLEP